MFRRDPEPFLSYCESATCHECSRMRKEAAADGRTLEAGIVMPRPTLAVSALGALGAELMGFKCTS